MTHLITSTCSAQRTHNSGSSCTGWLQQQGSVRTLSCSLGSIVPLSSPCLVEDQAQAPHSGWLWRKVTWPAPPAWPGTRGSELALTKKEKGKIWQLTQMTLMGGYWFSLEVAWCAREEKRNWEKDSFYLYPTIRGSKLRKREREKQQQQQLRLDIGENFWS